MTTERIQTKLSKLSFMLAQEEKELSNVVTRISRELKELQERLHKISQQTLVLIQEEEKPISSQSNRPVLQDEDEKLLTRKTQVNEALTFFQSQMMSSQFGHVAHVYNKVIGTIITALKHFEKQGLYVLETKLEIKNLPVHDTKLKEKLKEKLQSCTHFNLLWNEERVMTHAGWPATPYEDQMDPTYEDRMNLVIQFETEINNTR